MSSPLLPLCPPPTEADEREAALLQQERLRVQTVERLAELADQRKSVTHRNWSKPLPAIVVLNMAASVVLRFIRGGLTEYVKPERKSWLKSQRKQR